MNTPPQDERKPGAALAVAELKRNLRLTITRRLRELSPERKAADSSAARALLQKQVVWRRARSVLFFASLAEELDVWPLLAEALAEGKRVALPCFTPDTNEYTACEIKRLEEDIRIGQFGIREPQPWCVPLKSIELDLVLVPGLAFDLQGRRLGRGKGYFDRLLTAVRGAMCGVAFEEQIEREVPTEPHDVLLNCILTPTRWIET